MNEDRVNGKKAKMTLKVAHHCRGIWLNNLYTLLFCISIVSRLLQNLFML